MLVKNAGKKTIGFGALVLPPDAVDTLPEGYGADHPTVKFYLAKKWLVEVKGGKAPTDETPPPITPPELTPEQIAAKQAEEAVAAKRAEIDAKIKSIGRMNLEPLRGEAFALGIEWTEDDTKATLVQKITEKLQAEMG